MLKGEADEAISPLLALLRERIRRDGPLRVDEYMLACFSDPQHGYWRKAGTIGAEGDFITAPEISQTFGELIGLWCVEAWRGFGKPASVRLIELGPGRGTLLRDALRAAKAVPEFVAAISVHLVEISPQLREEQQRTLGDHVLATSRVPMAWHESLQDVPPGPALLIANEFLDALPIRQLICVDGAWRERVVTLDGSGALHFAVGPCAHHESEAPAHPGDIVELRAGEEELLGQLARRVPPLVGLFIDYGPAGAARGDTLQAVRRHSYTDPLAAPGRADLTADVQFAGLVRKARAAGFDCDGPMTQAEFLGRLGIAERAARLMSANPDRAGEIEAGVQRLISPTGMGTLFKVLAIRSRGLSPPVPFG
jgi:SAM-dependent MidA family methyltransferase